MSEELHGIRTELAELRALLNKRLDSSSAQGVESGSASSSGETVSEWGKRWLERRAQEGVRSTERLHRPAWTFFVDGSPLGAMRLANVTRVDARAWWTGVHAQKGRNPRLPSFENALGVSRLRGVLSLVRTAFQAAADDGLILENPFDGLRVHPSRRASTKVAIERVLRPFEQAKALAAIPYPSRWIAEVALYTGLRKAELLMLRIEDADLESSAPTINVRYGGRNKTPTKGGRARRIPLLPMALTAMRAWLKHLRATKRPNPLNLVFPGKRARERNTHTRLASVAPVARAIGRRFTWHDWRHTAATSLVLGWWGPQYKWSKEAIQAFLGHASVTETETYARIAQQLAFEAAGYTPTAPTDDVTSVHPRAPAARKAGRENAMMMTGEDHNLSA